MMSGSVPRMARPRRASASIGLTPLIDVVFILLLFFMLATSFLDLRSIELATPSAAAGGRPLEGSVLVRVHAGGGIDLAGAAVPLDGLAAAVADRARGRDGLRVVVRPSAGASYQETVAVLDRLAGLRGVDIAIARAR